jgi:hypothetical protein
MAQESVEREFAELVNMQPKELERWLESDTSKSVGQQDGDGESKGHASGRRILRIKRKQKAELSDEDREHMRRVVGYIKRHLAQRPEGDIKESRWRYSLMNWGHDPCKENS